MGEAGRLNAEFLRSATTSEIAMELLRRLVGDGESISAWNTINTVRNTNNGDEELLQRLSDAWAWLAAQGFVGPSTSQPNGGWQRVTTAGREAATSEYGAARAWAEERLSGGLLDELHSARSNFERGDYDTSVFSAFKAVEVRVGNSADSAMTSSGKS